MHKYHLFKQRLKALEQQSVASLWQDNLIGLEKESLRVNVAGSLAQTDHPKELGAALTHPYITTDYSEALSEFITPPMSNIPKVLTFLQNTQAFVYKNLSDELLWATSMPCVVAGESSIPLARYGSSNAAMMKNVYRRGLGHRYGRAMQLIAGVHFNFSVAETFWPVLQDVEADKQPIQDYINTRYFDLIRNSQRLGWLVPYLFGASPAVCKSFLFGNSSNLDEFDDSTYYEPYATSLRMGDIGYQNNKENESGIKACYKNIDSYISSLEWAINTPYKAYEKFGLYKDGKYQQLNTNILQIENEYYSTIRPKQILCGNEKPTLALKKRGVNVELRSLDVNAYDPLGVNESQLYFLEAFLLFCLLNDSPVIDLPERQEIDHNEMLTAHRGRTPGLKLMRNGESQTLSSWALEICQQMQGVCRILDADNPEKPYTQSLAKQQEKVLHADLTPSAKMLEDMRENKEGFHGFARRMSIKHADYYKNMRLTSEQFQFHQQQVDLSQQKLQYLEKEDSVDFNQYLQEYFNQR